ncbi:MAG: LacI family DNA-binding transcriptional regulator [Calditrichaceae bacterium]|jgi:LacI family transcriptional regulator
MKHIKQIDIAKKLNVSRITVSKALRNHPDISVEMKKKIHETAEGLGYIPNLIAQNLISKKTYTIGVIVPDLENSFFAYATDSIIDAAGNKNYIAFVTVSRENQRQEKTNIQKLIGMRVDGLLVCVTQQTDDPQIFNHIKNLNIPLVFFDRQFTGLDIPSVTFDDRNGAIAALGKIIDKGYKKIAHIAGYSKVSIGKERCEGFKQALRNKGLKVRKDWIVEGGFEVKDGYEAFMKIYKTGALPEIIFAVNDRTAQGVYQAANKVGLRIPEDIGVAAFGFSEIAQTFTPSLSIINQNPRNMGSTAADMLIETIENKNFGLSIQVKINEEFKWNESILIK